MMYFV